MNITSENTMIFAKEFDGKIHYRAGLSRKNQDGSYDKAYVDVKFPKGVEIVDRTKINITKGFLTFVNVTSKEGKKHAFWYIVIQEYTSAEEVKKEEPTDPYEQFGNNITVEAIDDADLPF